MGGRGLNEFSTGNGRPVWLPLPVGLYLLLKRLGLRTGTAGAAALVLVVSPGHWEIPRTAIEAGVALPATFALWLGHRGNHHPYREWSWFVDLVYRSQCASRGAVVVCRFESPVASTEDSPWRAKITDFVGDRLAARRGISAIFRVNPALAN